jgi:predicted short-subunit dehydrogenase-like oxidoreductase (DUF2520 family)
MMKLVIIGSGNTATVLGRMIRRAGHTILQVAGRNPSAVSVLANELSAKAGGLQQIDRAADIYLVAISDKALPLMHEWLRLEKGMVVHTAAAVSKEVLADVGRNYGVIYPLQTLRKEQQHYPEIPFLVDGNTPDDLALVQDFATTLSKRVEVAGDEQRLRVHVAAVFASNFTNHLYALADDFCKKEKVDFSLLLPLVQETARRIQTLSPHQSQTGPAVRNDSLTIERHLEVLNAHPHLREVYMKLTESIQVRDETSDAS